MAGSAGPAGRGFGRALIAHVAGGVAGGAVLGGVLAALAAAGPVVPAPALAASAVVLAALQLAYPRVRLGLRRQVPQRWRETLGPHGSLAAYGAVLAIGVRTHVSTFLFWLLPIAVLGTSPATALVAGVVFGGVRAAVSAGLGAALRDPAAACALLGKRRLANAASAAALVAAAAASL